MQNWCEDLSVTGKAGTSWLTIMVQSPNSFKLVFILFFEREVLCDVSIWRLCRVNGGSMQM